MIKVVLIRHGETEWNVLGRYQGQSNIALSAKGLAQAQKLADNFPFPELDAIYASDLSRAMMTAEAIAAKFSLSVQPEIAFREINFGDMEGLTYPEMAARWPEVAKNFFTAPEKLIPPNGETFQQVAERAQNRLTQIVAEWERTAVGRAINIAIVAHGAINRALLTSLMHIPLHYIWTLRQDNTAVNILHFEESYVMVELLNSVAHLGSTLSSNIAKGQSPI